MAPPAVKGPSQVGVVHVHSAWSHDGRDSLDALRAFAAACGIAFVGLTDHAEDFDQALFAQFVAECRRVSDGRIRLIPGLEFRFAGYPGLHLLALGLRRWIAPTTPAEFAVLAPEAAGLTIMAHPVLPDYHLPSEVANTIDAVEVWNASYNTRYLPDPRALRLLELVRRRRPEVVGVAGLDQHDAANDRETRVILLDPEASDPLAELRAGRFLNVGRTMRFASRNGFGVGGLIALTLLRGGLNAASWAQTGLRRALRRR